MFGYFKNNHSIFIASNGLIEYQKAIVSLQGGTETFSIQQIHTLNKSDFFNTILQKYVIQHTVVGDRLSDINAARLKHHSYE